MAILKFKNARGEWESLTLYTVQPIVPVQTTGSSTSDIMSQNAVTVELNKKANSSDVYSKTDVDNSFLTKTDASSTYLSQSDATANYLTKTDASSTYVTTEQANQTFVTETEVNQIVYGQDTKPETPVTVVTTENLEETLNDYSTSTEVTQEINNAVNGKADKATTLADYGITDAKIEGGVITLGSQTITPLTSVPAEYVTESELTSKGYQTASDVNSAISQLVDSAPETLDTLNELAAALGDDPNFATTISNQIGQKADKTAIPTAVSQLTNDSDYQTAIEVSSAISTATSSLATKTELNGKADTNHTHTVSQISDLNSGWDSLFTAAPSAYVTRWPSISEVTGKNSMVVKLNGGTSEGSNQFTFDGTAAKTVNITASGIGAAASSHTHTASQITDISNYATTSSVSQAISDATFNNGVTTASSVSNISVTHRLAIVSISGDGSFSLASTPAAGREIHVVVRNTGSGNVNITVPSNTTYITPSGAEETITIAASGYADINVVSNGTNMFVRGL